MICLHVVSPVIASLLTKYTANFPTRGAAAIVFHSLLHSSLVPTLHCSCSACSAAVLYLILCMCCSSCCHIIADRVVGAREQLRIASGLAQWHADYRKTHCRSTTAAVSQLYARHAPPLVVPAAFFPLGIFQGLRLIYLAIGRSLFGS